MACRMVAFALDSHDPEALATFWCDVLGYVVVERDDGDVSIGPPPGTPEAGRHTIDLLRTSDPKLQKIRLHIDVKATDRDQDAELQRLLDLGAKHVDIGQGTPSWYVLADPEGNEFCLLRTRTDP